MKAKRIIFGTPTEIGNPADLSRSFLFPFSCVDTDLVGSPEEVRFTSQHRLIVTVDHHLFLPWEFADLELIKVAFEIGRRNLVEMINAATLEWEVRVLVHTGIYSGARPYDSSRIVEPEGATFEVQEERRIGYI